MPRVEVEGLQQFLSTLEQAPDRIREGLEDAIYRVADAVAQTWKGLIRSRTGEYANSIIVVKSGTLSYEVSSPCPHGVFVEEGTQPHMIYPRRIGGVLRFETGGDIVFSRYVFHPGTWPQGNLDAAMKYHEDDLENAIKDGVEEWLQWSSGE